MEIELAKPAVKALAKMPANDAIRIRDKIEQLAAARHELENNIKALKGMDAFRLRVGNYRVIFTETGEILAILNIATRGNIY